MNVGRHNAIDKLAGYMFLNNINSEDKILIQQVVNSSEMVIKTVMMKVLYWLLGLGSQLGG